MKVSFLTVGMQDAHSDGTVRAGRNVPYHQVQTRESSVQGVAVIVQGSIVCLSVQNESAFAYAVGDWAHDGAEETLSGIVDIHVDVGVAGADVTADTCLYRRRNL